MIDGSIDCENWASPSQQAGICDNEDIIQLGAVGPFFTKERRA